jgi:hypothetical protein
MDPPVLPNPSPGVAQAIAAIDAFLAELRALRAQLAAARHPSRLAPVRRRARRTRRRILRQLARPGRN